MESRGINVWLLLHDWGIIIVVSQINIFRVVKCDHKVQTQNEPPKKKLQSIPGVGKSIKQDLLDLGNSKVDDLRWEDPEKMYQRLIALRGHHVDRCMLYVFRCATYFAKNSVHDPKLLKWWNWKDRK